MFCADQSFSICEHHVSPTWPASETRSDSSRNSELPRVSHCRCNSIQTWCLRLHKISTVFVRRISSHVAKSWYPVLWAIWLKHWTPRKPRWTPNHCKLWRPPESREISEIPALQFPRASWCTHIALLFATLVSYRPKLVQSFPWDMRSLIFQSVESCGMLWHRIPARLVSLTPKFF